MAGECVVVFYGLRWTLGHAEDIDERTLAAFEEGKEPRIAKATKANLQYRFGLGDSEHYYLMLGAELGVFGPEDEQDLALTDAELDQLRTTTRAALKNAGFSEVPSLQIQLEIEALGGSATADED